MALASCKDSCQGSGGSTTKFRGQLHKTKLCTFWLQNKCARNDDCKYAHGKQELKHAPNLLKTTMCANSVAFGSCEMENCPYAHSSSELRSTQGFYKTTMCALHKRGTCTMGSECRHAHSLEELHANKCSTAGPQTLTGIQRQKEPAVERQNPAFSGTDIQTNCVNKKVSCKGTQTEMTWIVPESEKVQRPSSPSSIPDKSLRRTLLCHGLPGNGIGGSDGTDGFLSMTPRWDSTFRDGTFGAVPFASADAACVWTFNL